jgi:hypothetical protein
MLEQRDHAPHSPPRPRPPSIAPRFFYLRLSAFGLAFAGTPIALNLPWPIAENRRIEHRFRSGPGIAGIS